MIIIEWVEILEQLVGNTSNFFPRLVDNFPDERKKDTLIGHIEFIYNTNFSAISITIASSRAWRNLKL